MDLAERNKLSFIYSSAGLWATLIAFILLKTFNITEINPWSWLILILGVDVSHVYSTLYRTYLNSAQRNKLGPLLWIVPLSALVVSLGLSLWSLKLFWSLLAYTAIFHFSRQQIGFFRWLNKDQQGPNHSISFKQHKFFEGAIYLSTLGSVLLWHIQGPKNFNWFIKQDLFYLNNYLSTESFFYIGLKYLIIIVNLLSLLILFRKFLLKKINIFLPLLILSTWVSWFIPIVIENSDFFFTTANVLAHGVPYLFLVWSEEKRVNSPFKILELFLPLLIMLALIEEALWDGLIWREHIEFFEAFYFLPQLKPDTMILAIASSFLILPQLTHYILDGFIWKKKYLQD